MKTSIHTIKMNKILLTVFIAILMVQSAAAELQVNKFTNEFSLSTTAIDGKACAGSQTSIPVKVHNVGDIDAVFEIHIISEQEDRFHVEGYQPEFELKQGESITKDVIADLPFDYTGTFDYTIKVTSTYGREKRLHRSLTVVRCQSIQIENASTTDIVDPAEVAQFSFTLKNPADFADQYEIAVNDHQEFVELSENEFGLGPGDSKEVFVYAKFPAEEWGDFDIPLTIQSINNGPSRNLNLDLRIRRAYQFAVDVQGDIQACSKVGKTVPVTIENRAGVKNTYDLSLSGASFGTLSEDAITLAPNKSTTVQVSMNPTDAQVGDYDVKLEVVSRRGDLKTQRDISLDVDNCFEHSVTMPESATLVCENETFNVNVHNQGTQAGEFRISSDLPDWATLGDDRIQLDANENTDIPLQVSPPCADQTYEFTVVATRVDMPELKRQDTMALNVVTPQSAYEIWLPKKNFDVQHDQDEFDVTIRNVGIREGKYWIDLNSTFLTSELEQVKIRPGESKQITLLVGNVSGLEPGEYLHDLTLALREDRYNVTYTATIGTNLIGPTLIEQFGAWLWDTLVASQWYITIGLCGWSGIFLLLALIALITVGVMVRQERIETERFTTDYRTHFEILNVVFLAIAIFGIVYFLSAFSTTAAAFYEDPVENQSALFHQWHEGGTYDLDLTRYFEDPDNDELTYGHNGTENLQVFIQNGTATLEALPGWTGTEEVVFTATDTAGATEDSAPMTMHVIERRDDISWVDYWLVNCFAFNVLLIGLIFLALFWLADMVEPRGREYYFGKNN